MGELILYCEGDVSLLFTENETNHERLFPGQKNESPYVKDGINDCVVQGRQEEVNPGNQGTKVAAHYQLNVGAGQAEVIRLRLSSSTPDQLGKPFGKQFDEVFAERFREADEFYKSVTPPSVSEDKANVMRQAIAGMLWSKQFFFFDKERLGIKWAPQTRLITSNLSAIPQYRIPRFPDETQNMRKESQRYTSFRCPTLTTNTINS